MGTKNDSILEKCKTVSRNAFVNIGNVAAGNTSDIKRNYVPVEPFTFTWLWPYEKKAPKRKG
jgi:hypothetical protein